MYQMFHRFNALIHYYFDLSFPEKKCRIRREEAGNVTFDPDLSKTDGMHLRQDQQQPLTLRKPHQLQQSPPAID
ncbi:hypothetical protein J6590_040022 [Homalodisca vitripennis]|nr:hypothetical protein J6590_040022 [Homalodisca vitripennis]